MKRLVVLAAVSLLISATSICHAFDNSQKLCKVNNFDQIEKCQEGSTLYIGYLWRLDPFGSVLEIIATYCNLNKMVIEKDKSVTCIYQKKTEIKDLQNKPSTSE